MVVSRKNNFYSSVQTNMTEVDLRSEFVNTMYGQGPEVPKSQPGLLRVFRRDVENKLIVCSCTDSVTGEPDRETRCPICLGEGYLWDEIHIDFYHIRVQSQSSLAQQDHQQAPGIMNTVAEVFYIPWQFSLTKEDKLVTLTLDKEGQVTTPLTRFQLFRISSLRPMRLDNGRLEFWKAYTYEDANKFL
jgi:hypothetical protein